MGQCPIRLARAAEPERLTVPRPRADTRSDMKAFLFLGGKYPERECFLEEFSAGDIIACADSGYDAARAWGLEPALVVGDMDSVSDPGALERLPADKLLRLEREKDDTDAEAALKELWRRGVGDVVLVGGGGGRLDHFLAIAGLFEREPRPALWLCDEQRAFPLSGGAEFECRAGELLSVFPLGNQTLRMRSSGLRWPLAGLEFPRGFYGISNLTTGASVRLETVSGCALIVRPYPARER